MSVAKYAAWELGLHTDAPKAFTGLFSLGEICFTIRCRQRVMLSSLRTEFHGMSVRDMERMEYGETPAMPLAQYWMERGLL